MQKKTVTSIIKEVAVLFVENHGINHVGLVQKGDIKCLKAH
jgi:hypothetical protein